jgi:hypothetical protein
MSQERPDLFSMMGAVFGPPTTEDAKRGPVDGPKYGRTRNPTGPKTFGDVSTINRVQDLFAPMKPVNMGKPRGITESMDVNGAWGTPKE